jgi:hypothetical protein
MKICAGRFPLSRLKGVTGTKGFVENGAAVFMLPESCGHTVALLNIEPLGSIAYGESTYNCSASSMCFSHKFPTQAVQYLAMLW